jgi:hypothetical protein
MILVRLLLPAAANATLIDKGRGEVAATMMVVGL